MKNNIHNVDCREDLYSAVLKGLRNHHYVEIPYHVFNIGDVIVLHETALIKGATGNSISRVVGYIEAITPTKTILGFQLKVL